MGKLVSAIFGTSVFTFSAMSANAAVITPSAFEHVATIKTMGEYDNAGLSYYNGLPVSATNHPSAFEDELSAQWDFYVPLGARNELFIVASDVHDTNFGYLSGSPFTVVALTGFEFSLRVLGSTADPFFSNQYALAGETLLGPVAGSSTPLEMTDGWSSTGATGSTDDPLLTFGAASTNDGLTHFSSVYGATRIYGGGVFEYEYAPGTNLPASADFSELTASASNGEGAYVELGTLTDAVPEPATWTTLIFGLVGMGAAVRFRRKMVAG